MDPKIDAVLQGFQIVNAVVEKFPEAKAVVDLFDIPESGGTSYNSELKEPAACVYLSPSGGYASVKLHHSHEASLHLIYQRQQQIANNATAVDLKKWATEKTQKIKACIDHLNHQTDDSDKAHQLATAFMVSTDLQLLTLLDHWAGNLNEIDPKAKSNTQNEIDYSSSFNNANIHGPHLDASVLCHFGHSNSDKLHELGQAPKKFQTELESEYIWIQQCQFLSLEGQLKATKKECDITHINALLQNGEYGGFDKISNLFQSMIDEDSKLMNTLYTYLEQTPAPESKE